MKKLILKSLKKTSYLAIFVATMSVNTTCTWIIHQPSIPKELKKLKKL
ncbi:cyclic lactone autoinducer peptide [Romboutsia sp. 1001216sp1]|nr:MULTISPECIES: cyclic lactone autoinducer peptide [unclassified Romboutsia]MDB8791353.1 cyclic lactone autoinducer peptide [Romboutsia sp. 1001216sp1]MDB8794813.1 cyclic lactone autoinducer peptide [Romboutsia sp. 1001216sp1]MDB8797664.1 cyclic lactone autoinducer peptide [Romboutsia sp. 1001216sp1]MDB8800493.1 cyclic lactone autoinducer peptide [Romboutsia sp. 1001216sp1]MDB8803315.1 cyclic lactone autoinducer peptide [Romboutsia sp. 1001216sp1]